MFEFQMENDYGYEEVYLSEFEDEESLLELDWDFTVKTEFKPIASLGTGETRIFNELLSKYRGIFAYSLGELQACRVGTHKIKLTDDTPFFIPPYRKAQKENEIMKARSTRKHIIELAHLLGHFGFNSTYDRIKEEYWWYKMCDEIKNYIKNCEPCQRNQRMRMYNHPAKVLKIGGIFDTWHMDLVLGFPESEDGYIGLQTILIAAPSFLICFAIKSKTMEEVGKNYWNASCQYGPPKVLITDNGNEFCNKFLNEMLEKQGVEQRCISAYFPRSNGKIERVHPVIVNMLRKHAENDKK